MSTLSKIIDGLHGVAGDYNEESVVHAQIMAAIELLEASQEWAGWCYHIATHNKWIEVLENYESKMRE